MDDICRNKEALERAGLGIDVAHDDNAAGAAEGRAGAGGSESGGCQSGKTGGDDGGVRGEDAAAAADPPGTTAQAYPGIERQDGGGAQVGTGASAPTSVSRAYSQDSSSSLADAVLGLPIPQVSAQMEEQSHVYVK